MGRESGYYWIKISEDRMGGDNFEIAFYQQGEGWYSIWDGGTYSDDEIITINEERIIRKY